MQFLTKIKVNAMAAMLAARLTWDDFITQKAVEILARRGLSALRIVESEDGKAFYLVDKEGAHWSLKKHSGFAKSVPHGTKPQKPTARGG